MSFSKLVKNHIETKKKKEAHSPNTSNVEG
jgi:hypothetical protein